MKIYCASCGKQCLNEEVSKNNERTTTLIKATAMFHPDECICGHCSEELDENGLFPEEIMSLVNNL